MSQEQTTPNQVFSAVMDIENSIGEIAGLTSVMYELMDLRAVNDSPMDFLVTELSVQVQALETRFKAAFDAAARCRHNTENHV